jgi:hypothetical protein
MLENAHMLKHLYLEHLQLSKLIGTKLLSKHMELLVRALQLDPPLTLMLVGQPPPLPLFPSLPLPLPPLWVPYLYLYLALNPQHLALDPSRINFICLF